MSLQERHPNNIANRINVGTAPNTQTGDVLRTAFIKTVATIDAIYAEDDAKSMTLVELQNLTSQHSANIISLDNRVAVAENDVDNLETRMGTAEDNIGALDERIDVLEVFNQNIDNYIINLIQDPPVEYNLDAGVF